MGRASREKRERQLAAHMANNPQGSGRMVTHQQIQQVRTGPIPDPTELAGYEAITPGFANRILVMAGGRITGEFRGPDFNREQILGAALPP